MDKILMFSIDGATWKIIEPMIEKGELPNLARIREQGASGILHSMRPMASPMLWTTIATGKTPEKHGVKLFGDSSKSVRCRRIWQMFEERGHAVGLCGYLMTWPPDIVNGFVIPDLFALGPETHPPDLQFLQEYTLSERRARGESGQSIVAQMSFARKLLQYGVKFSTLSSALGYLAYEAVMRPPRLERFWRKGLLQPRIFADVFSSLYIQYDPAYAAFHYHLTDTLSHKFWQYLFPEEFRDVPETDIARYGRVIPSAYQEADRILGRLLGLVDRRTTVAVLSDHGFRPIPADPLPVLNIELLMQVMQMPEHTIPTRVGRSWYLISKDGRHEGIPQRIVAQLSEAFIRETEAPLFEVVERGDYVRLRLPFYRVDLENTLVFPGVGSFKASELLEYPQERVNSGTHHEEGIVLLYGGKIRPGSVIEGMTLLDVTPSLLALAGLPVARDMDGRVITEVVEEEWLQSQPITHIDSYEREELPAHDEGITPEEREKVMQRLRALGYL